MDAISVQSLLNRDASKRKRVNRNAKIKQYKLDARREQWLSQGKQAISATGSPLILPVHGHKEVVNGGGGDSDAESCVINHEDDPVDGLWCISNAVSKFISCSSRQRGETTDCVHQPAAAAALFNPAAAAKQQQPAAVKAKKGKRRSKKVAPEQQHEDDDWEAAADALGCQMNLNEASDGSKKKDEVDVHVGLKSKPMDIATGQRQPSMAWKANDACRPASLPKLVIDQPQQMMMQQKMMNSSVVESGPICCLICTEELDCTESDFIPCSCGFRLCLFCHHRISAEDGRCPGCRVAYRA